MSIKNLNVRESNIRRNQILKRVASVVIAGGIALSLTGCGNRDMMDTNKNFDTAIMVADDNNSALVIGIQKYNSYEGSQYQLTLDDDGLLLVSSFDAKLFNNRSDLSSDDLVNGLVNENAEITKISKPNKGKWNKDLWDTEHTFNKAIEFKDNQAIIYDFKKWTDYVDNQIQLEFEGKNYISFELNNFILMKEGSKYTAEDIAYGILGSDAVIKTFDINEGYKTYTKK